MFRRDDLAPAASLAEPSAPDEEAVVRRLDYERVLRQSRAAFDEGDSHEGLRLLELAASFERGAA